MSCCSVASHGATTRRTQELQSKDCPPKIPDEKIVWPELVGTDGEAAPPIIKSENPNVTTVVVLPLGTPVTRDFRSDRVRVFTNVDGKIVPPPAIG